MKNNPETHLIIFRLGDEKYGIKMEHVKEVTFTPPLSRMPKTPHFLKGLANIRGEIVAVIDLEDRLGVKTKLQNDEIINQGYTLVIEKDEDYAIGFIVQEIPYSLKIPFTDKTEALNTEFFAKFNKDFIEGVATFEKGLIIVLNISNILSDEEAKQLFN